jgi:positive regulator of sigma E activity
MKGACSGTALEREIRVQLVPGIALNDPVQLRLSQGQELGASILLFAVPVLVIAGAFFVINALGFDQVLSGLLALCLSSLWYGILYIVRHRLHGHFAYRVTRIDTRKEIHESNK